MPSSPESMPRVTQSDYRFSRITPDDHSAVLWVTSLLSLTYSALVLAVRLAFVKRKAHALDDVIITIAHVSVGKRFASSRCLLTSHNGLTKLQVVGFAVWASLFVSLNHGLGKSFKILDDGQVSRLQQVRQFALACALRSV